jgi:hypothetical protein
MLIQAVTVMLSMYISFLRYAPMGLLALLSNLLFYPRFSATLYNT